jgi:hypothetical protein
MTTQPLQHQTLHEIPMPETHHTTNVATEGKATEENKDSMRNKSTPTNTWSLNYGQQRPKHHDHNTSLAHNTAIRAPEPT